MNFVSYEQLHRDIIEFAPQLKGFEVILGIPRSGFLVATLLALHLGKRLGTYEKNNISVYDGGARCPATVGGMVVVDDSTDTGGSLNGIRFPTAVLYKNPLTGAKPDLFFKEMEQPRVFEWNLWGSNHLETACVDIDGVLCRDIRPGENNDANYLGFITGVEQAVFPTKKIHSIVTSRPESVRKETEQWLEKHNIRYKNLIMAPTRMSDERRAERKAEYYNSTDCTLFVESAWDISQMMSEMTDKPILCWDTKQCA